MPIVFHCLFDVPLDELPPTVDAQVVFVVAAKSADPTSGFCSGQSPCFQKWRA
jgi:hypothetical protein